MKIAGVRYSNSIFSRLIVTFLVIIIPIYALGIYIYNWGLHTVKGEISRSAISQVSFYIQGLEKEFERIKILQYDCLNDEYLNKLAIRWEIMNDYETIESIRNLHQRLVTIKNSSIYVKDVRAHILPIQKTISSETGINEIDMKRFQGIRVPPDMSGAQIISFEGGLFLSTLKQNNISNHNPLYLIEIELDQEVLKQALEQFNTYRGSGSFLVNLSNKKDPIIMNPPKDGSFLSPENIAEGIYEEENDGTQFIKMGHKGYYMTHVKSDYLHMVLVRYIPEEFIVKPLQHFDIWIWVFTFTTVCIFLIFSVSTYRLIHKPLLELVKSFRKVENGDLQVSVQYDLNDEFEYLYRRFNEMVKNLKLLIDQVYNQKIMMQLSELKQLQSQINPHFLYNSFFMINAMAKIGDDNLIPFTKYLGEYFRFVTRNSSDFVGLLEEVNHAKVYANIQLMRFSKRLQIHFAECPERYKALPVPRLILQPIIENAFEHGVEKKKNSGTISLRFETKEHEISMIVEDNGSDVTDERLKELQELLDNEDRDLAVTGIINIHQRIRLIYGEKSGLRISRSEMGGLKVVLKILIRESDKHV